MRVSKRVPTGVQEVVNKLEAHDFHVNLNHNIQDGITTLKIEHPEGMSCIGVSKCSPKDNFDRAVGTRIAFDRAMHDFSDWVGRRTVKNLLK